MGLFDNDKNNDKDGLFGGFYDNLEAATGINYDEKDIWA